MKSITIQTTKKIYFASDFHLGTDGEAESSACREKKIVEWLESIRDDSSHLFLVGDIFDYWFEYKEVIPKGFTRFLGKLAELSDDGVEVHFFTGNHDMWVFDYFKKELKIQIHRTFQKFLINDKQFIIGHGDGLGPGDMKYKFIKKIFANRVNQWLFARIHPNTGLGLMKYFSKKSRLYTSNEVYESEWLVQFCEDYQKKFPVDYYVFGHRHLPMNYNLSDGNGTYFNLGDWINHRSYGVFDSNKFYLQFFKNDNGVIFDRKTTPL